MIHNQLHPRTILYQVISAVFCVIAILSNIISAKMISIPFFHDYSIPAGLITYPITFLLANLVTEFYGKNFAKLMIYIALGMNLLSFGIIQLALILPAQSMTNQESFQAIMGLGGLRFFSSLTAYILAQIVDIKLYSLIKRMTGSRFLWLRNNLSTWTSQIIDTFVIDLIFLYWGLGMGFKQVASYYALFLRL